MNHRTVSILAIVVALAFAFCVSTAAQAPLSCGHLVTIGTVTTGCAQIDYDALSALTGIQAVQHGKATQIWLQSSDPDVRGFAVYAEWLGVDDYRVVRSMGDMQSIYDLPTSGAAIANITIEELKASSRQSIP